MNISFIGGGNMASALIGGLLQKGYRAAQIRVAEPAAQSRERIKNQFSVEAHADYLNALAGSNCIVLSVKPQQMREAVRELSPFIGAQLLITIAAGVRSFDLSRWLSGYAQIVRVMPNTPALVHSGIAGMYALPGVSKDQKDQAEAILGAVGATFWVDDEVQLDAVTALSGSGPGYVCYFMEALERAAKEMGFAPDQARKIAVDTFLGSAKLASQSDESLETLRARVTSKGGTTEQAIMSMQDAQVSEHIVRAIHAARERSRELGEELGKAD
jgi:pyrroline-5-carboxylate reductase